MAQDGVPAATESWESCEKPTLAREGRRGPVHRCFSTHLPAPPSLILTKQAFLFLKVSGPVESMRREA
jgi:hypothetical protein